jgi:predicted kinase
VIAGTIIGNLKHVAMIIIVFGLPGSGKSYFAERLAADMGAAYINSDRLRKKMFSSRTYAEQEKEEVYLAMLARMKEAMLQKTSIVIDATFHREKIRKRFIAEAGGKGHILFIEVRANEDIIRERLSQPRPDSEADYEVYRLIQKQWQPLKSRHLVLESTNSNIEYMLQKTAVYLQPHYDK